MMLCLTSVSYHNSMMDSDVEYLGQILICDFSEGLAFSLYSIIGHIDKNITPQISVKSRANRRKSKQFACVVNVQLECNHHGSRTSGLIC